MENNKNNNFDLDKELMPVYVRNIKINYLKQKELAEAKERAKIEREKKEGFIVGGAAVLAAIIGISIGASISSNIDKRDSQQRNVEVSHMMEDSKVLVVRYYKVQTGDNLYSISEKTGIPIDDIRKENGMDATETLIFPDQRLSLSYYINSEDLDRCTEKVVVNGQTAKEIADAFDISEESLQRLNPNSIIMNHNEDYTSISYTITSDTIAIPNFMAIKEGVKGPQK